MKSFSLQVGSPCEVRIAPGLLSRIPAVIQKELAPSQVILVSDEQVFPLYGRELADRFTNSGIPCFSVVFPGGEKCKTLAHLELLWTRMQQQRADRQSLIIALGGGVTGDLAGFAAATYMRGIPWIQIPTSLLAMIDSSLGGKTAINYGGRKNVLGAFHHPRYIFCDPRLLQSLPDQEITGGMGELIKTAFLAGEDFFTALEKKRTALPGEALILRALLFKAHLVETDARDRENRRLLNLGHSFGHAIEACSEGEIPHGQAVAIGMAMISRAAVKRGYCDEKTLIRLEKLLDKNGLPRKCPFSGEQLIRYIYADKKTAGEHIALVVPRAIGHHEIIPVLQADIPAWLQDGGAQ